MTSTTATTHAPASHVHLRHYRVILVAWVFAVIAVRGVRAAIHPDPAPLDVLLGLAAGVGFALFVRTDAHILGHTTVRMFLILVIIAWPVLVPCYLIWSRGWKGFAYVVVGLVVLGLCAFVPALVTQILLAMRGGQ